MLHNRNSTMVQQKPEGSRLQHQVEELKRLEELRTTVMCSNSLWYPVQVRRGCSLEATVLRVLIPQPTGQPQELLAESKSIDPEQAITITIERVPPGGQMQKRAPMVGCCKPNLSRIHYQIRMESTIKSSRKLKEKTSTFCSRPKTDSVPSKTSWRPS